MGVRGKGPYLGRPKKVSRQSVNSAVVVMFLVFPNAKRVPTAGTRPTASIAMPKG